MNKDNSHTLSTSFFKFVLGTFFSRCTGLIREVLMAAAFGASAEVAAFWMAFRFSQLFRRVFGEGALNVAFIPHYESLKREDMTRGIHFFSHLSTVFTLLLLGIIVGVELILGTVLFTQDITQGAQDVISLTMILLPVALFVSIYALNTAFLNCERSYFLPSVAPTLVNILWIIAAIYLWKAKFVNSMHWLAMGVAISFVGQWAVTQLKVSKILSGFKFERDLAKEKKGDLWLLLKPISLSIIGVTATQINSALDGIFARFSDAQGPAYLWYALRLQQLPLAFFGVGITSALLPPLSRALEEDRFTSFLKFSMNRLILFMVPATSFLCFLALPIVNLIYRRGAFSLEATYQTSSCLIAYSSGLLPMAMVLLLGTAFYAKKNYRLPAFVTLYSVALNCLLNAIFVFVLHWGAVSVAIATSLASVFNLLLLMVYFKNGISILDLKHLIKVIVASLLSGALAYGVSYHKNLPSSPWAQLIFFVQKSSVFGLTFLLSAYFLQIKSLFELIPAKAKTILRIKD